MLFKDILGQDHIKNHLTKSVSLGRIPHAQLFVGPEGSGTLAMAIAYSQYILCSNSNNENNTGNPSCNLKFENYSHPDLHFVFPVATNDKVKSHAVSGHFLQEWRQFLKDTPYGGLFDWFKSIGIQNKQGQIGVDEAAEINKALSLKSYEGGYKIMIIWMADKMNTAASNKLLKLLEEPPNKTVFLLITESVDDILQTILSRCQVLDFIGLSESVITEALVNKENCAEKEAQKIAHQSEGNFNKAMHLLKNDTEDFPFESWFIEWVRSAFKAKGNAAAIQDLITWSETIASLGREVQKQFLHYCIHFFRQALLSNYQATDLVFLEPKENNFDLKKFAPFIDGTNITLIFNELEQAIYQIERNGNSKIILTDLSIKLTRLLHKK
ncbi:DNA polymerase III subunit delta' [Flavobacterium jejuense]|uniref:DNA polymerase III subunit delta n=1 Tax=Flavobacterium jejuense TaxID=1544455 RepID=A0ABX0IPS4_9FLAO|nr:DNA polymerase III subunit delta' [Flavobacterium jejuense]NHN25566.1 DNA polymerase III subunit delta' [Flavobacterium jejuense]